MEDWGLRIAEIEGNCKLQNEKCKLQIGTLIFNFAICNLQFPAIRNPQSSHLRDSISIHEDSRLPHPPEHHNRVIDPRSGADRWFVSGASASAARFDGAVRTGERAGSSRSKQSRRLF